MSISALLLQKPSKFSKLNEHLEALTRQLSLWNEGRVDEILYEDQNIHDRLEAPGNTISIIKISKKFKFLISKGNVNGAFKLSTNSIPNGICPLSNKTLDLLKQEHPEPMESYQKLLYRVHTDKFTLSHMMTSMNLW